MVFTTMWSGKDDHQEPMIRAQLRLGKAYTIVDELVKHEKAKIDQTEKEIRGLALERYKSGGAKSQHNDKTIYLDSLKERLEDIYLVLNSIYKIKTTQSKDPETFRGQLLALVETLEESIKVEQGEHIKQHPQLHTLKKSAMEKALESCCSELKKAADACGEQMRIGGVKMGEGVDSFFRRSEDSGMGGSPEIGDDSHQRASSTHKSK